MKTKVITSIDLIFFSFFKKPKRLLNSKTHVFVIVNLLFNKPCWLSFGRISMIVETNLTSDDFITVQVVRPHVVSPKKRENVAPPKKFCFISL